MAHSRTSSVLIVGFGITGRAVATYCARHGTDFSVSDARRLTEEERDWLAVHASAYEDGEHTLALLADASRVIVSPGIPLDAPLIVEAERRGIEVLSELDFACQVAPDRPILAVTGTDGKSTTVAVLARLLRAAGWDAPMAGNIGLPLIEISDRLETADAVVVEASSYQLAQSRAFHPHVAVLLNLAVDHVDHHGGLSEYRAAKQRIFRHQGPGDIAIVSAKLAQTIDCGRGRLVTYDDPHPALPRGSEALPDHQRANVAAAVSACLAVRPRFDPESLRIEDLDDALHLAFRQQEVGSVRGIRVINDSKATTPHATIAAVHAVRGPVVLLLGGRSKRAGYEALAEALRTSPPKQIIVFGEAADELAGHVASIEVPFRQAADARQALIAGLAAAQPGEILLFSPACASFDEFRDYIERGEALTRWVMAEDGYTPPSRLAKDA